MKKIYISCDIEGLAGIADFDMESDDTADFRELYHWHLKWVLQGIKESQYNESIEEITISDSHSKGVNLSYLRLSEMDDRVALINGFPRYNYMMTGLTKEHDLVIFLGYHGGIGTIHSSMDHGYSARVAYDLKINGEYVNETTINASYASEVGVPVGLIIGDEALKKQLHEDGLFSSVPVVTTKEAYGRYSIKSKPMNVLKQEIIAGVKQAIERPQPVEQINFSLPATVDLQCTTTAQADRIEMLSHVKRLDGRMVSFTGDSMEQIMNDIVGIVGLGGTTY
ncbi:M55 family metallopeptidase [Vagococcus sp. DIV0080]|uniref:M55 family metallopeptidase n=1 Tax=Candidatus Vagococcus giribetii TaxID=2230876 RepID=A0ABS3HRS3_9ENTE|nr:M55 family metallopeptidase [Vagococcus sp. DIV0080]MBO0476455.1 M55 family metallopeptidase [Vagococcus sp. DIV0080]